MFHHQRSPPRDLPGISEPVSVPYLGGHYRQVEIFRLLPIGAEFGQDGFRLGRFGFGEREERQFAAIVVAAGGEQHRHVVVFGADHVHERRLGRLQRLPHLLRLGAKRRQPLVQLQVARFELFANLRNDTQLVAALQIHSTCQSIHPSIRPSIHPSNMNPIPLLNEHPNESCVSNRYHSCDLNLISSSHKNRVPKSIRDPVAGLTRHLKR